MPACNFLRFRDPHVDHGGGMRAVLEQPAGGRPLVKKNRRPWPFSQTVLSAVPRIRRRPLALHQCGAYETDLI